MADPQMRDSFCFEDTEPLEDTESRSEPKADDAARPREPNRPPPLEAPLELFFIATAEEVQERNLSDCGAGQDIGMGAAQDLVTHLDIIGMFIAALERMA